MTLKYHGALLQSALHCSDDDTFPPNLASSLYCAKANIKNATKK